MQADQPIHVAYARIGNFRLSNAAITALAQVKGKVPILSLGDETRLMGWGNPEDDSEDPFPYWHLDRTDPDLIRILNEFGPEAAHDGCVLSITQVPAGSRHFIYDGDFGERVGFTPAEAQQP